MKISDAAIKAGLSAVVTDYRADNPEDERVTIERAMRVHGFHHPIEGSEMVQAILEAALPHLQPTKPEAVRLRDELRERAAFEAWARGQRFGVSQSTQRGQPTGHYELKETRITWRAWQAALASVQPSPAGQEPVAIEVPQGAIVNGAAFADRLERDYQFECPAGMLVNCTDYVEFRRCFDYLAQWASSLPPLYAAPPAQAVDLGKYRQSLLRAIGHGVAPKPYDEAILRELLALIDSGKAVQS